MDFGSDFEDETKIKTMGLKGNASIANVLVANCSSTSQVYDVPKYKKINEIFLIGVVAKYTKIDELIDSGSQVNLIQKMLRGILD